MVLYQVNDDCVWLFVVFFQAEDGIRDLVRSRGLGDVYKRQILFTTYATLRSQERGGKASRVQQIVEWLGRDFDGCLLYTSDAADERSSVDLGGRRIIKKKN